jgi:hypothetical protein
MATATKTRAKQTAKPAGVTMDQLTPSLRKKAGEIKTALDKIDTGTTKARWNLGRTLKEIELDASLKYGHEPIKELMSLFSIKRDVMRQCMTVYAQFSEEEEFDRLMDMDNPDTEETLTWTHIQILAGMKKKADAMKMARRALTERMSSKELRARVAEVEGDRTSGGGRKPVVPADFLGKMTDLAGKSTMLANRIDALFTGLDTGKAAEDATTADIKKAHEALAALDALAAKLSSAREDVSTVVNRAAGGVPAPAEPVAA